MTVGIDVGTTSVKALAVDDDGEVVARSRVTHPVLAAADGEFAHDSDQAWRADVVEALGEVATGLAVEAVSVSAMVPSLGALDAHGHGLAPGLIYGDRRGWREDFEPAFPGDTGEVAAFLAWHASTTPEAAAYWPAQAVANHALCGEGAIEITTAMTAFPLYDLERWDETLAAEAGAPTAKLARVLDGFEPAGHVLDGLPAAGAAVGGGSVDAFAEQLVSGADEAGDVLVLCGTTLITWAVTEGWLSSSDGLWTVPHHLPDLGMIGGPSNAGGLFLDMVGRWLGPGGPVTLDDLAAAGVTPGDLPVWLPYVRGERTPLHRRDLRAGLHDVSHRHGPGHVRAAAFEASAFVVRHHLDLAREAGATPRRIVASGGGTRADAWMQALADCTGLPVDVAALPEGAALGGAFLARCTAGLETDPREASRWARTARTVEPRPDWVDAVNDRYARFRALSAEATASD